MRVERVPRQQALLPDHVRLARRVVYQQRDANPELLWFDVPAEMAEGLDQSDNGWLVALLPLALRMREPLQLSSPVDEVLLTNCERLSAIWGRWHPEYPAVRLEVPVATSPVVGALPRTGLFFTGGVDSFFSSLHYDATSEPREVVDDLLFIWGYDLPLSNRPAFARKAEALNRIAGQLGKRAVLLATNLRETRLGRLDWARVTHGAALGAAALMLEGRYSTMLLSAALARESGESFGAHPLTDPLMSTGRTSFVHYGAEFTRFDKTAYIADSEAVRRHLHVCWEDASDRNCGRCEKCVRTQLALEMLGARTHSSCFDPADFSLERAATVRLGTPATVRLMEDLRDPAVARGRADLVAVIDRCLESNRQRHERLAGSKWRRRAAKWKNSFQKRWLRGSTSVKYWALTLAIVAVVALQFSDCFLDPDPALSRVPPFHISGP
ncbi:MAG: hypothetical protein ABJC74_10505 [Gemmatimonadota bacterium]